MSPTLLHHWHRLRGSDRLAECLRVLLALGGVMAYCLLWQRRDAVVSAMLGVIACALAETEDHWRSRLRTLLLTLACFTGTAFVVEGLLPYPLAFALLLPCLSFVLVMLGAISARYATVAGSTLILAVYTMIGTDQATAPVSLWSEPLQLMAGAAWYGLLSLLWSVFSPQLAVRHALSRVFDRLADYMESKAALFTPVQGVDRDAVLLQLAMQNERVVQALNDTRIVLIDRIGLRRPRGATAARLQLYFAAQDIHERISSAHYSYAELAAAFYHSDVLFRCEHLLRMQARQCRRQAQALRLRRQADGSDAMRLAQADLHASIDALRQSHAGQARQLQSLRALERNIGAIRELLEHDAAPLHTPPGDDSSLQNPGPANLREALARIVIQLSPRSSRFRHAVRLSLALMAGYGVLHALHPRHGYWILLTTLLVCQPSYGATLNRMLQRVGGTMAGLLLGWGLLRLLPQLSWQWGLIALSAVVFFAARLRRYTLATTGITVFVVLCFNQAGNGYEVMWPRMLDTLIGAALAALAIYVVMPDWRGRQLEQILANTLHNDAHYLRQVIAQYTQGKRDDLPYRVARREAHNADAALSGMLANMLREPGRQQRGNEALLRFMTIAHTLLGHISALGAHRHSIGDEASRHAVTLAGGAAAAQLQQLAQVLENTNASLPAAGPAIHASEPPQDEHARLVLDQLDRIMAQRERLAEVVRELREG